MRSRQGIRGIAVPVVVLAVVIAAILVAGLLSVSMQETRNLDMTFDRKMAFLAAEAGMNKAAALLIAKPFYQRWYLIEAGNVAKSSPQAGIEYLVGRAHKMPAPYGPTGKYLDTGEYDVMLMERVKKFPTETLPSDTTKAGFQPKDWGDVTSREKLENRLTNAKTSHVDILAKGTYTDPGTKHKSECLLYGKFVVMPEPFTFEYDTNNDGKITYYGSGTGEQGSEASNQALFNDTTKGLGNDYMNHPFLDKAHWQQYSPPDLLSQMPIVARVIKVRPFFDKDLLAMKMDDPKTMDAVKDRLREINLKYLANFAQNKDIIDTARKMMDKGDQVFAGVTDTVTDDQMKGFLASLGGVKPTPDMKSITDKDRNEFLAYAIRNFRYEDEGPAYKDLEFNIAENPLGSLGVKSKNLGKVFNLDSLSLDTKLVDDLKAGKVKTGEQLLTELGRQSSKPLSESGMSTADYVKRMGGAIQEYAVVQYPLGTVEAKWQEPTDIMKQGLWEYRIGSEFETELNGGPVADPNGLYARMYTAANTSVQDQVPGVSDPQEPTITLSPKPPEKAENNIPILLVNNKDPRLTTKLGNVLDFYFKYVDFETGSGDETYLDAKPGDISIDVGYMSKWKCKCLTVAKIKDETLSNSAPSASGSAIAAP